MAEKEQTEAAPAAPEQPASATEAVAKKTEEELANVKEEPGEEIKKKSDAEILRETWKPKTELGRKILAGEISDIDEVIDSGKPILEPEVVDLLLPDTETDLLLIGQAKGKFGGGQRRVFRQTQKKTREGNKIHFAACAVVGNKNGYVGVGYGKSKETVPAREKAIRNAKLNLIKIRRGSGSWESDAKHPTSVPFAVTGRCGSVRMTIKPAPKGKGIIAEDEVAKILRLAGIEDAWTQSYGQTKTKINLIQATVDALKKLMKVRVDPETVSEHGIVEGRVTQ